MDAHDREQLLARIDERTAELDRRTQKLERVVSDGNGKPALVGRVERLEEGIKKCADCPLEKMQGKVFWGFVGVLALAGVYFILKDAEAIGRIVFEK